MQQDHVKTPCYDINLTYYAKFCGDIMPQHYIATLCGKLQYDTNKTGLRSLVDEGHLPVQGGRRSRPDANVFRWPSEDVDEQQPRRLDGVDCTGSDTGNRICRWPSDQSPTSSSACNNTIQFRFNNKTWQNAKESNQYEQESNLIVTSHARRFITSYIVLNTAAA